MRKMFFAVIGVALLAACNSKVSDTEDYLKQQYEQQFAEATVEAPAVEDKEMGYYCFDVDSTIKDFVHFSCANVKQVVLPYYADKENLMAIHCAIDDIVIEKGWRYPFEDWLEFRDELQDSLVSISYELGEIEVEID